MKKFLYIFIFFLMPFMAFSQDKWEGGLMLGYTNYLGDMVEPTFTLDQASFAGGLLLRHHLTPSFGMRGNLIYGKVKGADRNYERLAGRGSSFESNIFELSLMGEYELLGKRRWDDEGKFKKIFTPYVFAGLGLGFTSSDIELDAAARPTAGKTEDLNADFNENMQFALPIGAGVKLDVSRRVNVGLELGWRMTFSDYLDGLSAGGDPDNNDLYLNGGLVLGVLLSDNDADDDGIADKDDACPNIPGVRALNGCPDMDGDGVTDAEDGCPNTPGEVRLAGCPDRDNDGIADNIDDCPDDAGLKRLAGCPDSDSDGIVDKEDNCPTVAGIASMNGCPDADRDGIADDEDACPEVPGPAAQKGCPDSDNDGVADNEDNCPTEPGLLRFKGCPDADLDGVPDAKDKCPTVAGLTTNDGCPEITVEDKATLDFAMKNVRFATGSDRLLAASSAILDEIAILVSRYPGYALSIDGYTDSVGNDFANQQLSERRAKMCRDYLVGKGISADRMSYVGHGENRPIASNGTAEGRRLNRRVEFTLTPQ